jgi:hypothetical protein
MPGKTILKRMPKKQLTDEELLILQKAKKEEREKDLVTARELDERLPHLSHHQLRGELRRIARGERTGKGSFRPSQRIAFATVLLTVLDTTKTTPLFETNKGKARMARPDQINPNGRLHAYPL